jgi:hypothetical protein
MQALRNCSGKGTPAKVELNHQLYRRCPRAIYLESVEARFLVGLYFDCRQMNMYPVPGGPMEQTAFTIELFEFLDSIVAETQRKAQENHQKSS